MRLFLDDVRMPYEVGNYIHPVELRKEYRLEDWHIVRNYEQFVEFIEKNGMPTHVSFDHDLADEHYYDCNRGNCREDYDEKTGYDAAKYLCAYCQSWERDLPICYIHSMNPIGRERIKDYLNNYLKH